MMMIAHSLHMVAPCLRTGMLIQYLLISHGHGQPSLKSWLREERGGVGEKSWLQEERVFLRTVILVTVLSVLVSVLLLLQHDETRMLHVY